MPPPKPSWPPKSSQPFIMMSQAWDVSSMLNLSLVVNVRPVAAFTLLMNVLVKVECLAWPLL